MLRHLEEKAFIFPSRPPAGGLGPESGWVPQGHQPRHSLGEFLRLQKRCKPTYMAFEFQRSYDYAAIEKLVTSDRWAWAAMTDDTCPSREDFRMPENDSVWYVLVREDGNLLGFWALIPQSEDTAEVHTCLKKAAWGAKARTAAREMARWIWANTPFIRLTTTVPAYNRTALAFAKISGMERYAVKEESYPKHGKMWDQILLDMYRPETASLGDIGIPA